MVQAAAGADDDADEKQEYPVTLGNLSILLLLNLACHHPAKGCNPFKETLALFQNSQGERAFCFSTVHEWKNDQEFFRGVQLSE